MDTLVKVEGSSSLSRDVTTMAIINTSRSAYENYMLEREAAIQKQREFERQAEEINNIKKDVADIKEMLLSLLQKG